MVLMDIHPYEVPIIRYDSQFIARKQQVPAPDTALAHNEVTKALSKVPAILVQAGTVVVVYGHRTESGILYTEFCFISFEELTLMRVWDVLAEAFIYPFDKR